MQLYNAEILRWATKIKHTELLAGFDVEINHRSRVCGSHMTVRANIENDIITGFSWHLSLCALGQAAAGILSPHIVGLTRGNFEIVDADMRQMVHTGAVDFHTPFEDLGILSIVHKHPGRWGSVLLPFDCLASLFQIDCDRTVPIRRT